MISTLVHFSVSCSAWASPVFSSPRPAFAACLRHRSVLLVSVSVCVVISVLTSCFPNICPQRAVGKSRSSHWSGLQISYVKQKKNFLCSFDKCGFGSGIKSEP